MISEVISEVISEMISEVISVEVIFEVISEVISGCELISSCSARNLRYLLSILFVVEKYNDNQKLED